MVEDFKPEFFTLNIVHHTSSQKKKKLVSINLLFWHKGKWETDKLKLGSILKDEGVWDTIMSPPLSPSVPLHLPPLKWCMARDGCALVRGLCLKMLMDGGEGKGGEGMQMTRRWQWWSTDAPHRHFSGRCLATGANAKCERPHLLWIWMV